MSQGFFDTHADLTRRKVEARTSPAAAKPDPASKPLTVSELTRQIEHTIKAGFPNSFLLRGEVSKFSPNAASGHVYFTLKDADACIDCVMWASDAKRLKYVPAGGDEILATGSLSVYGRQGRYQFYATRIDPIGQGALEAAFRQLHARLEAQGLFALDRKKPLPPYPARIAIVTSRSTAALQDILKVLRRYPWLQLMLYHVPVQGTAAAAQIAAAFTHLSATHAQHRADLILLARGGGSLEDLWAFNEEPVARAIAASAIPVITGIGHEIDTSIADLVADHHAHTPTEAAQVAVTHWRLAAATLSTSAARLTRAARHTLQDARHRLTAIERHETFRRPLDRLYHLRQLLDDRQRTLTLTTLHHLRILRDDFTDLDTRWTAARPEILLGRLRSRLQSAEQRLASSLRARHRRHTDHLSHLALQLANRHPRHRLALARQTLAARSAQLTHGLSESLTRHSLHLDLLQTHLNALNPDRVLARGYSLTTLKDGTVIRDAAQVRPGARLNTRLAKGSITSIAADPNQPTLFE